MLIPLENYTYRLSRLRNLLQMGVACGATMTLVGFVVFSFKFPVLCCVLCTVLCHFLLSWVYQFLFSIFELNRNLPLHLWKSKHLGKSYGFNNGQDSTN